MKVVGPKRVEVTVYLRKLHNEDLLEFFTRQLSYLGDQMTAIQMGGLVARMGERKSAYGIWCRYVREKTTIKPIFGWDNNIKMDLKNVGREDVDWIDVAEDKDKWRALVDTDMNLRVPQNAGNCLTSWGTKFFK
jgi:hypothetical protein